MTRRQEGKKDERPIVCGTDFSPAATEAVEVAAALGRRLGAKLVLAYVEQVYGLAEVDPALFQDVAAQKRDALEREAGRLRAAGNEVETRVLSGSAFDELVSVAIACEGRVLIVGAVGHGLARRLLVGSVAERTAETSPIPTLVVRPGSRLGSWLRGEHALKIVAGYDFSPASDAALRWISDLRQIEPCDICVLHTNWPPDEASRLGYRGALPLINNPAEIQDALERELAERIALQLPPEQTTVTIEAGWGHAEGYLFEIAQRQQVDLIVVGTHRRQGWSRLRFGSVSRGVLHHAEVSVAVIPSRDEKAPAAIPKLDRVLVATDFSELGNRAVPYGCAIVQRGGTLQLLHITEAGAGREENEPRAPGDDRKLHEQLRALVPAEARDRFEIETEVVASAAPAAAIRQAAERFRADAICVGSHGRSGLAKTFLGSVAQGVLADTRRPVLVVRAENR